MPANTSIYLTVVAESHEEFVKKIIELYDGFCRPANSVIPADFKIETLADNLAQAGRTCEPDISADLQLTLAGVDVPQEGPKQQRRRGRPRKNEMQEAAALAPPAPQEAPAAVEQSPIATPEAVAATPASAPAAGDIPDFLKRTPEPAVKAAVEPEAVLERHVIFAASATKDDVRNALNAYVAKHGMPEGRALVQKVCGADVLSLSQIPEDKYAAMVAAATETA